MMKMMFEQAQWFTQLWTDMAVRMAGASFAADPTAPPPEAARQTRTAMFQAMSKTADDYMRMPQFLQMVKQSMDLATTCRKQMNDFLTEMHHNAQGIAKQDIDQLMLSVRHLETRVLDGMEQICGRMEEMSQRIAALESVRGIPTPVPTSAVRGDAASAVSPGPSIGSSGSGDENATKVAKRPPRRPRDDDPKRIDEEFRGPAGPFPTSRDWPSSQRDQD